MRLVPPRLQEHFSGKGEIAAVAEWVKQVDVNGDGELGPGELKSAMYSLKEPFTDEEVALVASIIDTDNNGSFSVDELVSFVKLSTRSSELAQKIAGSCTKNRRLSMMVVTHTKTSTTKSNLI